MASRPKFQLRQRLRVPNHPSLQWGTVIERIESVDRAPEYILRLDPVDHAVLQPERYTEAALVTANATEPPADPFATADSPPAAKARPSRRKRKSRH